MKESDSAQRILADLREGSARPFFPARFGEALERYAARMPGLAHVESGQIAILLNRPPRGIDAIIASTRPLDEFRRALVDAYIGWIRHTQQAEKIGEMLTKQSLEAPPRKGRR